MRDEGGRETREARQYSWENGTRKNLLTKKIHERVESSGELLGDKLEVRGLKPAVPLKRLSDRP